MGNNMENDVNKNPRPPGCLPGGGGHLCRGGGSSCVLGGCCLGPAGTCLGPKGAGEVERQLTVQSLGCDARSLRFHFCKIRAVFSHLQNFNEDKLKYMNGNVPLLPAAFHRR